MGKAISQQTIADSLGVSQSVVSGVLNNRKVRVSEEVRVKIKAKARELNYQKVKPDRGNEGELIAFIVHEEHWDCLPLFLQGVHRVLDRRGALLVQQEWRSVEHAANLLERIKGCIALPADFAVDEEALKIFSTKGPVVLGLLQNPQGRYDCVVPSLLPAYRQALKVLEEFGHRRFGYFGIRRMGILQAERVSSFQAALLELDLPLSHPEWVALPYRKERCDEDTTRLITDFFDRLLVMEHRPTALFFETALYADLFRTVAEARGFSIPGDISLVTHVDRAKTLPEMARMLMPWEALGYAAAAALTARLDDPDRPVMDSRPPAQWLPGASIAPVAESPWSQQGSLGR